MEPDFETFDGPVPLFPLPNIVLLPYMVLPLHIFEPRYSRMVQDTMSEQGLIGMVRLDPDRPPGAEGDPAIRKVGCVGRIADLVSLPENRFNLKLVGLRRFKIIEEIRRNPYRAARVEWLEDRNEKATGEKARAARGRVFNLLASLAAARGDPGPSEAALAEGLPFSGVVSALAIEARLAPEDLQGLLELSDVYARSRRLERLLAGKLDTRRRIEFWKTFIPEEPSRN